MRDTVNTDHPRFYISTYNKTQTDVVIMEFSKAVPHNRVFYLNVQHKQYGVDRKINDWLSAVLKIANNVSS